MVLSDIIMLVFIIGLVIRGYQMSFNGYYMRRDQLLFSMNVMCMVEVSLKVAIIGHPLLRYLLKVEPINN